MQGECVVVAPKSISPHGRFRCRRPLAWASLSFAALSLLLSLSPCATRAEQTEAAEVDILLLQSAAAGVYDRVAEAVEQGIERSCPAAAGCRLRREIAGIPPGPVPDLLVTLGRKAALAAPRSANSPAVLHGLIPKRLYQELRERCGDGQSACPPAAAVYLDQPHARQIRLLKAALPDVSRVGMLVGPEGKGVLEGLEPLVRELGLVLEVAEINTREELGPTLQRLLSKVQVLLALPDNLVHNRQSVVTLLLASYRAGVPVLAFSRAYVVAGALMAVYSSPEQIGRQIADRVADFVRHGPEGWKGRAPHPEEFSVAVNPSVARSLGLNLPSAEQLEQSLRRGGT